jgi:membrane protease YdiL (CAAX protease family)
MKSRFGKSYVISLTLILAGVLFSAHLLSGPLKDATRNLLPPGMEDEGGTKPGQEPSSLGEKLYQIVSLLLLVYTAHLAARFLSDRKWRKKDEYVRDVRWTGLDILAMALLLVALAVAYDTFLGDPSKVVGETPQPTVATVVGGLVSYVIVLLFGIYILKQRGGGFAEGMGLTLRPYGRLIVIGVVAFLAFQPLHLIYRTAMLAIFHGLRLPIEGHPVVEELVRPDGIALKLTLALTVALSAPFFEEVFFRGFLYQAVRRRTDVWVAIVATSVIFAYIHPGAFQAVLVFPLGIMLAYLMEKTGSVIPCLVVHFLVNGTSLLATLLAT